MEQKILLFRSITQDQDIDKSEVVKFINWGKGDIQQALNYYYKNLEKGKIKRTSKSKVSNPQSKNQQPSMKPRTSLTKQVEVEQQIQVMRQSQISISSEEQFTINSNNAFDVLKKGSIQHKKTHDFIKHVRQIYKLPIKGKPQKQLLKASKSSLPDNQGGLSKQFFMADCLSQAFNSKYISQVIEKQSPDTDQGYTKNETFQNEKQKPQIEVSNKFIDLSISEEGQQNAEQQEQQQQSFKDIQHYEYKHVYTNSSSKKKQQAKAQILKQQTTKNNQPIQTRNETKQTKNKRQSITKNKQNLERQVFLKNQPQQKQTKLSKNMSIQQAQAQEYQMNRLKATKSTKSQSQQPSQKNKILSKSCLVSKQQIKYHKVLQEEQLYLGQYFVKALCTQRRRNEPSCHGDPVNIQTYIQQIKAKKKNFGRKAERNMNMRIVYQGRQIGRIADQQVRIIMPLIDQVLIRTEFYIQDIPLMSDILKPMTLKAKIFFLPKLITEPIIQTFQPNQDDKERVDQLSALLLKLNLPIITHPLIKAKSKYIKADKSKKNKGSGLDIMRFAKSEEQQQKIKEEREAKNRLQIQRYRSDPSYKQKQQSLKDIIHKNQQNLKLTPNKRDEIEYVQEQGQVKKKIIQIDSFAQKSKLTQLIQLHQQNYEPYYPEHNFVSKLYHYQALALAWMLRRQGFLATDQDKQQLHPLWTQYEIPTNDKYRIYFNELTGQVCVKRPTAVIKCKGGILADEMGLGKTVMMTALIVSNPPPQVEQSSSDMAGTLVIVPLTLLSQWQSQINKHTTHQKVIAYYSNERKKIINSLQKYNVVISTYGTVSHQYAQGLHTKKQGIYKYKWHRIILDQAHYIKGRVIQTSKAVYELNSINRWCLTGTPIQNQVSDIFSLLHFIKYTPWSQFACWNRFIVKPLEEEDQTIYQVLRTILKQVFLRRTKMSQGADGKPIIELPPRISKVQLLTMSEKQRRYYDQIYNSSRTDFDKLIEQGILQAKYMQVLQMLMRLRQICCHPILFKSVAKFAQNNEQFQAELKKLIKKSQKKRAAQQSQSQDEYYEPIIDEDYEQIRVKANSSSVSEQYLKQVLQKVANQNLDNCIICLNQPEDPVITCCLHIFCKGCNIRQIEEKGTCSFCRRKIGKDDCIHLPRENRLNIKKGTSAKDSLFPSTKMIALNEHLSKLQADDKAVVFSQFLGMLDLLQNELTKNNIKFVRMQGSNTHKQRTKIVKAFQQDASIQVFLVSLKTAGVGLNLVAANKVFLMDPWWNPAVEEQAIERVHRIGQKRQVEIFRFIMDRTIETRMLQLNTEKKALSQNVLNQNQDKDTNAKHKIEKLRYLMQHY